MLENSEKERLVRISNVANRGGGALISISLAAMLLLISLLWFTQFQLWQGLLLIGTLLSTFAGWAKLTEPAYFLQYDADGVRYIHRRGSWLLPWSCFLYCGIPQLNEQSLEFIGFKVTDYDGFLQHLPLRLAVKILTEQRSLYLEAVRQGCAQGQCVADLMAETGDFCPKQQLYHGIKAAFGRRMQHIAASTGYHLLVPVNLNETAAQQLCRQINQARLQLTQNTVT